jgi:hypothetical protein
MKKTILSGLLILIIALFTIAGCKTGNDINHQQPTTATLKISSQGALASGTQIGAADVTVLLPSGVTVQATPDSINPNVLVTNSDVVVASGVVSAATNTYMIGTYTAATAAAPGKLVIKQVITNGCGIGEFVTVNCNVAAGSFPTAAAFNIPLADFKVYDLNGAVITGLTPGFTADIK